MVRCIGIYFSFYYKHNNVSDEPFITFSDHVSCLRRLVLSEAVYTNRINVLPTGSLSER